jgi:hypothetical protein
MAGGAAVGCGKNNRQNGEITVGFVYLRFSSSKQKSPLELSRRVVRQSGERRINNRRPVGR